MKNCQNCGWSQELCGEHDCHCQEPKTTDENGVCSAWKPGLAIMEKAWETAYKRGCTNPMKIICFSSEKPCIQCKMDYAMKQAIEGGINQ